MIILQFIFGQTARGGRLVYTLPYYTKCSRRNICFNYFYYILLYINAPINNPYDIVINYLHKNDDDI